MKAILLNIAILMLAVNIFGQDTNNEVKTIFDGKKQDHTHGGYGAIMVNYGKINNRDGLMIGARGAWLIDHNFGLGLGGYGFMTDPVNDPNYHEDFETTGGYGGLIFEPIIGAKKPVHLSFPILIGAGGVVYTKHWDKTDDEYEDNYEDSNAFFVLEPAAELEFNMLKFFRIALSASYRFTSNINLNYQDGSGAIGSEGMLRGWNFGIAMKFGKF